MVGVAAAGGTVDMHGGGKDSQNQNANGTFLLTRNFYIPLTQTQKT